MAVLNSRGVIEKSCFLQTLRKWIEDDRSGQGPYSALRTNWHPVAMAFKKGISCTRSDSGAFYSGGKMLLGVQKRLGRDTDKSEKGDSKGPGQVPSLRKVFGSFVFNNLTALPTVEGPCNQSEEY